MSPGGTANLPGADGEVPKVMRTAPSVAPARREDEAAVRALLRSCGLPDEDVGLHLAAFLVACHESTLVATIGLEILPGHLGLLRSLAVAPSWRGLGLGTSLCGALIAEARKRGVRDLWLLTTSAERYFTGLGFASVARTECPRDVQNTIEFSRLCPATAICMRRHIADDPAVRFEALP